MNAQVHYDNHQNYTFIDFGSGYGNILYHFKDTFNKLIGIELNKTFYQTSIEYAYNTREIFDLNGDNNNYLQKLSI